MHYTTRHTVRVDVIDGVVILEQNPVAETPHMNWSHAGQELARVPLHGINTSPELIAHCLEEAAKLVRLYASNKQLFEPLAGVSLGSDAYGAFIDQYNEHIQTTLGDGFMGKAKVVAFDGEPRE